MAGGGTEWLNTFPHQECSIEAGALTQEWEKKKKRFLRSEFSSLKLLLMLMLPYGAKGGAAFHLEKEIYK